MQLKLQAHTTLVVSGRTHPLECGVPLIAGEQQFRTRVLPSQPCGADCGVSTPLRLYYQQSRMWCDAAFCCCPWVSTDTTGCYTVCPEARRGARKKIMAASQPLWWAARYVHWHLVVGITTIKRSCKIHLRVKYVSLAPNLSKITGMNRGILILKGK